MSLSLKIVLIVVVLIYILFNIRSVKKHNMRIEYLILWLFIGGVMTIALIVPNFVENISRLIGFEMPINMIFSVAIFLIMYILYNLTELISKEQKKNKTLIQEISILKKRLDDIEKNNVKKA